MKCARILLSIAIFGGIWRFGRATCVLESDFGFVINCAFKKSGLFRVRNLGGIKAHVGLGFSVGDDLGFRDSFANTDTSRRRSVQATPFRSRTALLEARKTSGNNATKNLTSRSTLSTQEFQKSQKILNVVPPFKPIPPAAERSNIPGNTSRIKPFITAVPAPAMMGIAVPAFNAIPASISRISDGVTVQVNSKPSQMPMFVPVTNSKGQDTMANNFALRTLPTNQKNVLSPILTQTNSNSINPAVAIPNITENTLEATILQRQQLKKEHIGSTTLKPLSKYSTMGKVMNAPKEYYPIGYDKNFDDNFSSRVELPETSFYCGEQKHFPGLYADEDLGCMVFHVCALTDDGLIMKSFLCPESTLFDQTILKCNWWFYVDCKNSKKLYDSNIPISKSYQLMKALSFFSSYKKESSSTNKTTKLSTKD